jgi:hypothetical protein
MGVGPGIGTEVAEVHAERARGLGVRGLQRDDGIHFEVIHRMVVDLLPMAASC